MFKSLKWFKLKFVGNMKFILKLTIKYYLLFNEYFWEIVLTLSYYKITYI